MSLDKRSLGRGGARLEVSSQGFGCMGLTAFYGTALSDEEGLRVLQTAFDSGVTHFDTAQIYQGKDEGGNHKFNEELVGKFVNKVGHENVTVATKFYMRRDEEGLPVFSTELFWQALQESLDRLSVDCIDLYYLHRIYPDSVVSIEDFMGLMKQAVQQGKVKHIGLSEASARTIQRAHSVHPLTCVQQEWSLFARDLEASVVPACRELGVGVVAYSPVARGFLAGVAKEKTQLPKDWRSTVPYMLEENFEANSEILQQMEGMAKSKDVSLAQLCLAWVMAQGEDVIPIPGTTKCNHVLDNVAAAKVELTQEEVQQLAEFASTVKGERANEAYMKNTFHSNS